MLAPIVTSVESIRNVIELQAKKEQDKDAVAAQLEGMFATVLIKTMRQTIGGEGLFPGDSADVLGSLFDQFMAEEISAGGDLVKRSR